MADLDKCANDIAHHVFQETIGIGMDEEMVALAGEGESLEIADRVFVVGQAALEGGEVLFAYQEGSGLPHVVFVERPVDMPHIGPFERRPFRASEDLVFVELPSRRITGMKVVRHERGRSDSHIVRESGIESFNPLRGSPVPVDAKTDHLSEGVNARVGTSGSSDGNDLLRQLVDCGFEGFLNRWLIWLALPTGITCAVVFDNQLNGLHGVVRATASPYCLF